MHWCAAPSISPPSPRGVKKGTWAFVYAASPCRHLPVTGKSCLPPLSALITEEWGEGQGIISGISATGIENTMFSTQLEMKLKLKGLVLFIEEGQKRSTTSLCPFSWPLALFPTLHGRAARGNRHSPARYSWPLGSPGRWVTKADPSAQPRSPTVSPTVSVLPNGSTETHRSKSTLPPSMRRASKGPGRLARVALWLGLASPPKGLVKEVCPSCWSRSEQIPGTEVRAVCFLAWCVQELTDPFRSNYSVILGCTMVMGSIKLREHKMELITFYQ